MYIIILHSKIIKKLKNLEIITACNNNHIVIREISTKFQVYNYYTYIW